MSVLSRLLLVASLALSATGKRVVDVDRQKLQADSSDAKASVLKDVHAGRRSSFSIPDCEVSTECPVEWKTGAGGFYCYETKGCRPVADGPFPRDACEDQCYIGAVDVPATTTEDATITKVSGDPLSAFAEKGGLTPSESNGCARMLTWHGDYTIDLIGGIGMTVDISGNPYKDAKSQYSTIKFTRRYRNSPMAKKLKEALRYASDPRLVDSDDDEEVIRSNSELAEIFCALPESEFEEFCNLLSEGSIDTMCSDEDIFWDTRTITTTEKTEVEPTDEEMATTTEETEVEPTDEEMATTTAAEDVGDSTTATEASADPFKYLVLATGGLMASPSNGCALHGWHGEYKTYAGAPAMTVDVYPLSTTVTFSNDFKDHRLAKMLEDNSQPKTHERIRKVHEIKRKNSELAEKFCASPGWGLAELCSFFSPGGAHLHCAQEAVKKAAAAAKNAGAAVKETAATAVDATKDFVKEVSKDPLESPYGEFMWKPMGSNGCTLTGWSGRYSIQNGLREFLKVDVSPTSTTFNFMLSPQDLVNDRVFLLNGTHSNEVVADMFCSTPLLNAFPNACAFWSPSSLNKLCPGLVAGHAVQAAKMTYEAAHAAAHAGYKSVKNYFGW